ncbi:MAG: NAD-dependent deacylase [Candidatus Aminicenantes bacterium]|nr:NAD-dependent deacylase [Candidatus Aminicenantes bacterium]
MAEGLSQAAALLRQASHAVVFTGAGISVESGIPPFRGPGGLWSRVDPSFIEIGRFLADPEGSWRRIKEIFYDFFGPVEAGRGGRARPNAAHFGIAALEAAGRVQAVITQNIDNLHQEAGSREVIEFHGNSRRLLCLECGRREEVRPERLAELPPYCPCGGLLKPDFIFFGEGIPELALKRSYQEASKADLFLIVGSSGEVQPACQIPVLAKSRGAKLVEINLRESNFTPISDVFLQGPATEIVGELVNKLGIK